jgi:hypothetical protein
MENPKLEVEFIQPWSDIVMRVKLPDSIVSSMIDVTDNILNSESKISHGNNLAGQIEEEFIIPHEDLKNCKVVIGGKEGTVHQMLESLVTEYIKNCYRQVGLSTNGERLANAPREVALQSCWIVNQKPGEYNPIHLHTRCHISAVFYLSIPEFLKSTKPSRQDDGCIVFIGPNSNSRLSSNLVRWKPSPGDMFIFPSHLQHCVYPFRSKNNEARRSVSFNASFKDDLTLYLK